MLDALGLVKTAADLLPRVWAGWQERRDPVRSSEAAARYLREKGITGVRLAGFDGITEARSALHQRQLVATIDQHASEQGYLAVRLAVDAIAGRPLAEETLVDTELLTATATPSP